MSQNLIVQPVRAKLDAVVMKANEGTITSSDVFKLIAKEQISKAEVQLFVKKIFFNPNFFETSFFICFIFIFLRIWIKNKFNL